MNNKYSFIVPVYNRPQEIKELLQSFCKLNYSGEYEVVIVEDGSTLKADAVVKEYVDVLNISYFFKTNTGPGDSRNFGMQRARGNYFIILDSDVVLATDYLKEVDNFLKEKHVSFFGGPDAAHSSFSNFQKAVSYVMTSFLTTGGLRGSNAENYEPRSFNMGISKEAFKKSGGFGHVHPGEDPDLSIRLRKLGYKAAFIPEAVVYHKRRIDFEKFFQQVKKFGMVRPILLRWHPSTFKITFFFPSFFIIGLLMAILCSFIGVFIPLFLYILYFLTLFMDASIKNKSILIGGLALIASFVQFIGYGIGFFFSFLKIKIFRMDPEKVYPKLFFKNVQ